MVLKVGQRAVDFKLEDKDGKKWELDNFKDEILVLYFYPKDNTEGCAIEANDFSRKLGEFHKLGAEIIGVSGGDNKSKEKFCSAHDLKIILLSDSDFKVCKKYGIYGEKQFMGRKFMGIFRTTFVIRDDNIVKVFENVKARGHAEDVLDFVKNN